jgi:hypothetical protein
MLSSVSISFFAAAVLRLFLLLPIQKYFFAPLNKNEPKFSMLLPTSSSDASSGHLKGRLLDT